MTFAIRTAMLAALWAPSLAFAQSTFYVDPATGVDTPGGGSAANPFRTIGFATGQMQGGDTVLLNSGVYSPGTNGETFPIPLPTHGEIRGIDRCGAVIDVPAGPQVIVFQIAKGDGTGTPVGERILVEDIRIDAPGHRAFKVSTNNGSSLAILAVNLDMDVARGLECSSGFDGYVSGVVEDSRIRATDAAFLVRAEANSADPGPADTEVVALRTSIDGAGLGDGLRLETTGGAAAASVSCYQSSFFSGDAAIRTVQLDPSDLGEQSSITQFCSFSGWGSIITDDSSPLRSNHGVEHCVFWANTTEIPGFTGPGGNIGVEYSIVQSSALLAGMGNFTADPLFVNASVGDFHLRHGSPAINASSPAIQPDIHDFDLDGDPRQVDAIPMQTLGCVDDMRDIGSDEYFPAYTYFRREQLPAGVTTQAVVLGPINWTALLYGSVVSNGMPFCQIQLGGSPFLISGALALGATGTVVTPFTGPSSPGLAGVTLYVQGALIDPIGNATWTLNAETVTICEN